MKLTFKKHGGPIFKPAQKNWWSKTHAQTPISFQLDSGVNRVFYSTRDNQNQSRVSFFDTDANDPSIVIYRHDQPILEPGPRGSFDDAGVMPTCVIKSGDEILMYFVGWTVRKSVPYQNGVGLAVSRDGVSFTRVYRGPILRSGPFDPFFVGTTFVSKIGPAAFNAYYLSCNGWKEIEGKQEPIYDIKLATSKNGHLWDTNGKVVLPNDSRDQAIASANILVHGDRFYLLYSSRKLSGYRDDPNSAYRVRFASSEDGISWTKDPMRRLIPAGKIGSWDYEMQAYAFAVNIGERYFVFYNGNGFGQSGVGFGELVFEG